MVRLLLHVMLSVGVLLVLHAVATPGFQYFQSALGGAMAGSALGCLIGKE